MRHQTRGGFCPQGIERSFPKMNEWRESNRFVSAPSLCSFWASILSRALGSCMADNTEEGLLKADTMLSVWPVCPTRLWARSKDYSVSLFVHPSPKHSHSRKSSLWGLWGCSIGLLGQITFRLASVQQQMAAWAPERWTPSLWHRLGSWPMLCFREALKHVFDTYWVWSCRGMFPLVCNAMHAPTLS